MKLAKGGSEQISIKCGAELGRQGTKHAAVT